MRPPASGRPWTAKEHELLRSLPAGNPEEIRPKVMKIRKDYEGKVGAILGDAQKKQWQEMLGKPFDLGD